MGGRITLESVAGLARNTHLGANVNVTSKQYDVRPSFRWFEILELNVNIAEYVQLHTPQPNQAER